MKYLMLLEIREPVEENYKKAFEIESERRKKGETWSQGDELLGQYHLLSEPKSFQIVDTEDVSKLAKWVEAYRSVVKYKILPILDRKEWKEATK